MLNFIMLFVGAFMVGVGFTLGYSGVNILLTLLLNKIKLRALHKQSKKAEERRKAEQEKEKAPRLCAKCNKAPRPPIGLYCAACRIL